jgi:O-acetyl-ADP-ribose deacetylase (regulator of RNase III)
LTNYTETCIFTVKTPGVEEMLINIEIIEGDISTIEADALVNAANNHFWMGAGVAGALKRAGGIEIEQQAVAQGPVPVGEAVATRAGRLKAKYVIHAAVMGQDLRTSEDAIKKATENSLRRADELGVKSIAFPALGTGVGGFPLSGCAHLMINVVKTYAREKTGIEHVIFVLYGEPAYRAFEAENKKSR